MAPTVRHGGFLVPNAGGLPYPRMAEVDQIDFNTLSQSKWAVVDDCKVSVTVTRASTTGGVVIVNGILVNIPAGSGADLSSGLPQDRFDLVVAGSDGTIKVIEGTQGFDPVLPDPPTDSTTLAAVFCPASATSFSEFVIDKRVMAPHALLTKLLGDQYLVRNVSSTNGVLTDVFSIRGDGHTVWSGDTSLYREDVRTLRIIDNLNLGGVLQVGGDLTAENLTARNLLRGKNLFTGTPVGDEPRGALRQDPTGRLFVLAAAGWVEVATIENTTPVGTIIQSVEVASMMPFGWVWLNGDTVSEHDRPSLFGLEKMAPFILPGGTPGNRSMKLPNMDDRVLVGTSASPSIDEHGAKNTIILTQANLPAHVHGVRIGEGGAHTPSGVVQSAGAHTPTMPNGGSHPHAVSEDEHRHHGFELGDTGIAAVVMGARWDGANKIDALFNDRNHTWTVDAFEWTMPAKTNLKVLRAESDHSHLMNEVQGHVHGLVMNAVGTHTHDVSESSVGNSAQVNVRQASFSVYMYIKA